MRLRRRFLTGVAAAAACATLVVATTSCDVEQYGGYSAADGQYWRSKGICAGMAHWGAQVRTNYCFYPIHVPSGDIQFCMQLAVAAFPSQGMDTWPAASWLAGLCGAQMFATYVF